MFLGCLGNAEMNKEQKQGISQIVDEFVAIKYELSLYVDDGLMDLGESLENAINKLIQVVGTSETEPMPEGIEAQLQNESDLAVMTESINLLTSSLNQPENNEKEVARPELPNAVFSRAPEVQPALRYAKAATEIINLSNLNREALQALFPSEHAAPKEAGKEAKKTGDEHKIRRKSSGRNRKQKRNLPVISIPTD
jgi:hypothetical protein